MYNCSGTGNAPCVNIKEGPSNSRHCSNNIFTTALVCLSVPSRRETAEEGWGYSSNEEWEGEALTRTHNQMKLLITVRTKLLAKQYANSELETLLRRGTTAVIITWHRAAGSRSSGFTSAVSTVYSVFSPGHAPAAGSASLTRASAMCSTLAGHRLTLLRVSGSVFSDLEGFRCLNPGRRRHRPSCLRWLFDAFVQCQVLVLFAPQTCCWTCCGSVLRYSSWYVLNQPKASQQSNREHRYSHPRWHK